MDHPTRAAAAPRGRVPSGGELAGLGVFLAVVVVLPLLVGAVIDNAIHTTPLLLLAGLVLGIVAGGAVVYTRFKRYL
jgi:predicted ABC-type sugar transport system permease subunit